MHLAVDNTTGDTTTGDTPTGEVLAHDLTSSAHHDGPELPGLLAKLKGPVQAVCADGACDADHNHAAILARGATPIVGATPFVGQWIPRIQPCCASLPPRKGAAISPPPGMKDPPPQLAMLRGGSPHCRGRPQGMEESDPLPPAIIVADRHVSRQGHHRPNTEIPNPPQPKDRRPPSACGA